MAAPSLAGFVLAGGRSSRMGEDKALLQLGGISMAERAVSKLRSITELVYILGSREELSRFAPLVPDLRESCGPLSGLEAALSHSACDWSLVLPVDMPFVPAALLRCWVGSVLSQPSARVACFVVDEVPQPTFCLLHRQVLPFLTDAAEQGRFKLYPVLEHAANELACQNASTPEAIFPRRSWKASEALPLFRQLLQESSAGDENLLSEAQRAASYLWFENLNTPEQFAEAEQHVDAV
jgi:molybdopterin-guanine dinucleotide biosynthesis protein A